MVEKVKKIGSGTFGNVWLVRKDQQLYAMKRVPYDPEKHKIPLEIEVLKQLDSPYIVKYHDSFIEKSWLCIVMEYCEGGDLQKLIQAQREHGFFTEQQILTWFTQMCLALQHMHSKKILHRDLKPQNIFLASPSHLKIGDFGISRCLDNSSQMANTSLGTPYYLSPEVCLGQPYDAKSDMWMLGCCLYELVTLQRPFTGSNLNQIVLNILNKAPDELGGLFGRLISMLLQKNAFARSDTSEILQVPEIAATVKLLHAQTTPQKFKSLKSTKAESNLKNSSILTLIQKAKETNMSPKKPLALQPQKAITVFLPEQIISEESKTIAPIQSEQRSTPLKVTTKVKADLSPYVQENSLQFKITAIKQKQKSASFIERPVSAQIVQQTVKPNRVELRDQFLRSKLGPLLYADLLQDQSETEMMQRLSQAGFSDQRASELIKIFMYVKTSQ